VAHFQRHFCGTRRHCPPGSVGRGQVPRLRSQVLCSHAALLRVPVAKCASLGHALRSCPGGGGGRRLFSRVGHGGLTSHSSRRLRRGLTRALGLHPLQLLRPLRGPLLSLGFGCIGAGSRRPRLWVHAGVGLGARIGRSRGPAFQGGLSLAVASPRPRAHRFRPAPACQAPVRGLASGLTVCSSGRRSVYQAQVIVAAGAA
jgi:hypothetical protein